MEATHDASHSHVNAGNGSPQNHPVNAVDFPGDQRSPAISDDRRGGSCNPGTEIVGVGEKGRASSVSECSVEVDLVRGVSGVKAHFPIAKKECRICQLSLDLSDYESGFPIELGCSCKDDLAAAHKHCAEAWFKIKGNKTCEICGAVASNVAGANEPELMEQWDETSDSASVAAVPAQQTVTRRFWQGHRFLNFLLGCMVFAFVISWLFHFNVPS